MCGLTGFWDTEDYMSPTERERIATRMTDTIRHRGPDDSGVWQSAPHGVVLGFRRLAIRDVSPAGHQPMLSASGRYALAFNGEVYNSDEMRTELERTGLAPRWRGTSDTETMLAAIEAWGLEFAVTQFVGMFAIALWDSAEQKLWLGRDRLGIKPLYYGWAGKTFLFGSELKTLYAHPDFVPQLNRGAVARFLQHAYIPAPYSIYENILKLPPGCLLSVTVEGDGRPVPYWCLDDVITESYSNLFTGDDTAAIDAFVSRARAAVRLRMIADVPLGAFLSGGLDSSLVVALMQEMSERPVQTFCIGFTEATYNEAHYARAVAKHLKTDHHELLVTPEQAMEVIPQLPVMFDEPFADASQIPTFLVSQLARTKVTVSLSGDGGDELLAGYNAYTHGQQIRGLRRRLGPLVAPTTAMMKMLPPGAWQAVLRGRYSGDRVHKLADALTAEAGSRGQMASLTSHIRLMSHWKNPYELVNPEHRTVSAALGENVFSLEKVTHLTPEALAMWWDTRHYLPDDILTKVDRASMAVALEARVPLLDHRLVAFCWSLPMHYKRRDGETKWILRQALDRYLPRELFQRPKRGFGIPIDDWLRGPLRPWAEELLSEKRLQAGGLLVPRPIRSAWKEHLSGVRNFAGPLWNVLMLQAWREHWKM